MLAFAIKIALAHFLGDFVLQSNAWVQKRDNHKSRLKYLTLHSLVHAFLLLFLLWFQHIGAIIVIVITHFLIDFGKTVVQNKKNKVQLFFIDQLAHILVLAIAVNWYYPFDFSWIYKNHNTFILIVLAIILLTQVTAIVMRTLLSRWKMKDKSPNKAGTYIGMIERLFIFGFIAMNYWEGIGFLLAAKSIFRFGDLNNAKDRDLTEYVLIGTLLSFGIAIVVSKIIVYTLTIINNG